MDLLKRNRTRDTPEKGPLTIAFVIFGLRMGGAEIALLALVKGLDRRRFRPTIISLEPRGALSDAFEAAGVEVHHLGMERIDQAPIVFYRAWRLVRRIRPAVLHGVMFYGDLVARLLRMLGETPRVVTALHTTSIGSRAYEQVMHWSDRYTDAVTAVSKDVARAQCHNGSIQSDKVTVIYNGIDLNPISVPSAVELQTQRIRFGIAVSDRVLLCVGRLEPAKEHALLLRAFASLHAKLDDVTLLLVGRGRLEGQLRDLAAELGIGHKVRFAGQLSNVAPAFHLADVFVLSSSREGMPLVVLEAMAAQRPMVLTSVGGIPEVIEHEKDGILVPPRDQRALSAALERIFQMNPAERNALALAARHSVERRFSLDRMVTATQDLYDQVLSGSPTAHRERRESVSQAPQPAHV